MAKSLLIVRQSSAAQWQKAAIFETPRKAMNAVPQAVWESVMPGKHVYISGIDFPRFGILPVVNGSEVGAGYINAWENV